MGPKQSHDGFAELDELTPEEIAENFSEKGDELADGEEHAKEVVEQATTKTAPLRPGHSIGGFNND